MRKSAHEKGVSFIETLIALGFIGIALSVLFSTVITTLTSLNSQESKSRFTEATSELDWYLTHDFTCDQTSIVTGGHILNLSSNGSINLPEISYLGRSLLSVGSVIPESRVRITGITLKPQTGPYNTNPPYSGLVELSISGQITNAPTLTLIWQSSFSVNVDSGNAIRSCYKQISFRILCESRGGTYLPTGDPPCR